MILAATTNLTYKVVSATLRRVFGDSKLAEGSSSASSSEIGPELMKSEPAFKATTISDDESDDEKTALWTKGKASKQRTQATNTSNEHKQRTQCQRNNKFSGNKSQKTGKNPVDNRGEIMKCLICGSRNHFARSCPDREDDAPPKNVRTDADHVFLTFFTFANIDSKMLKECLGHGILDTGCTSSASGSARFNDFYSKLSKFHKNQVRFDESNARIVFGSGQVSPAVKRATIPVKFGHIDCRLWIEIIDGYLPLLLSLKTMKKSQMNLLLGEECATFGTDERKSAIIKFSSGHILLPIQLSQPVFTSSVLVTLHHNDLLKVEKLHRQFGHCASARLKDLLKNAGNKDKRLMKLVDDVSENCKVCIQYGRSKPNRWCACHWPTPSTKWLLSICIS